MDKFSGETDLRIKMFNLYENMLELSPLETANKILLSDDVTLDLLLCLQSEEQIDMTI